MRGFTRDNFNWFIDRVLNSIRSIYTNLCTKQNVISDKRIHLACLYSFPLDHYLRDITGYYRLRDSKSGATLDHLQQEKSIAFAKIVTRARNWDVLHEPNASWVIQFLLFFTTIIWKRGLKFSTYWKLNRIYDILQTTFSTSNIFYNVSGIFYTVYDCPGRFNYQ